MYRLHFSVDKYKSKKKQVSLILILYVIEPNIPNTLSFQHIHN